MVMVKAIGLTLTQQPLVNARARVRTRVRIELGSRLGRAGVRVMVKARLTLTPTPNLRNTLFYSNNLATDRHAYS